MTEIASFVALKKLVRHPQKIKKLVNGVITIVMLTLTLWNNLNTP